MNCGAAAHIFGMSKRKSGRPREFGTWILLAGVAIAALGVMVGGVTGIVVVARFIFRLDAKVDRLVDKMDQLAERMEQADKRMERAEASISKIADSIVSLIERTA